MMQEGNVFESRYIVGDDDTALVVGSGDLPVLATPRLIAWMENAAMRSVAQTLGDNETTVGGKIDVSHLRPSAVGTEVIVTAVLDNAEGRKRTFSVVAKDSEGVIAEGMHVRFVVDRERFMEKLHR
jgi:predicted thioesterase